MKITLDLAKLLEQGKLSPAEAERLRELAADDTSSLAINILVGFGVVAVSAGAVALVPMLLTLIVLGLVVFAIGLAFTFWGKEQWSLLAQICLVVGALMFCGGVYAFGEGSLAAMLLVTAALAGTAIVARSGLLMVAAVLALAGCLGARAGYWDAAYTLTIYEPLVTIVLFGLLALATYYLSKSLAADYERLALIAARTSVFMVNFGFWVGSLWGDHSLLIRALLRRDASVSDRLLRQSGADPAAALCHRLGGRAHRDRHLGRSREPAMGGQCRRVVRRHPFLHAMVRAAGIGAAVGPRRRPPDARLRAGTVDFQQALAITPSPLAARGQRSARRANPPRSPRLS